MSARLAGHELRSEGAPHDQEGSRLNYSRTGGEGRAKCSCGDLSPILDSANKRKQWHRDHKATIQAVTPHD